MKKTNFYFCCNDTIAEIQSSFSHFYPYLKINFFGRNELSHLKNDWVMLSPEVKIRDICPHCPDGCIELNNSMTTDYLEKSIHDYFGLHVEISPRTDNQHYAVFQNLEQSLNKYNTKGTRLPERSDAVFFKNVPFGC